MLETTVKIGEIIFCQMIQIAAGCILAVPFYYFIHKRKSTGAGPVRAGWLIILASAAGMLLPLDIFGLIPLAAVLYSAGTRIYVLLPLFFSNALFNMLVPFNDPSFIWKTGVRRVLLAFAAGVLAGVVLKALKPENGGRLINVNIPVLEEKPEGFISGIRLFRETLNGAAIYLIVGVSLNELFHRYILFSIMGVLFTNPSTSFIPALFSRYDVVNPFFLLATDILNMFMDLAEMAALLAILRPKGFAAFAGYYVIWAVFLAIPAFIG